MATVVDDAAPYVVGAIVVLTVVACIAQPELALAILPAAASTLGEVFTVEKAVDTASAAVNTAEVGSDVLMESDGRDNQVNLQSDVNAMTDSDVGLATDFLAGKGLDGSGIPSMDDVTDTWSNGQLDLATTMVGFDRDNGLQPSIDGLVDHAIAPPLGRLITNDAASKIAHSLNEFAN